MNFVYADDSRNLLHLILIGTLGRAQAIELLEAARKALVPLRRGFNVLTDLRDLKEMEKDAVDIMAELMELFDEHGVGRVVRVLPTEIENFGFSIMSIFHYGHDVRFVTSLTLEEAAARISDAAANAKHVSDNVCRSADELPKSAG